MLALVTALAPLLLPPQDPAVAALQKTFAALPPQRQQQVLQTVAERLQQDDSPLLQRVRALAATAPARPPAPRAPRPHFDPAEFAPVAPARTVVPAGSAAWRRVRADFPPVAFVRDTAPGVVYDWLTGAVAQIAPPPTAPERLAALLRGQAPGADVAIAQLLQVLDVDAEQRELASWFGHLYADRDGRVFADIPLYEAWYSGRTVEVPDVDAIAFARRIVHTDAFVSPIPDGRRRDRLYEQIRAGFARHRQYRTLREAAAAAALLANPTIDPTYETLLPRMHLLWEVCGDDPAEMARRLAADDRSELLEKLDRTLRDNPDAQAVVAARRAAGDAMLRLFRSVVAEALAAVR